MTAEAALVACCSGHEKRLKLSRLGKKIPPGKWTTLSVDLEAPTVAGSYSATWRFAHGDGTPFGSTLPVSIKVEKPKPTAYP